MNITIKDFQLPRGPKVSLPEYGLDGQPYYAIDTNELYMGLGETSSLIKVGDIESIVESKVSLPIEGKTNKLYIVKNDESQNNTRMLYMYDTAWQVVGNIILIDDNNSSNTTVYSSTKVNDLLNTKANLDYSHSASIVTIDSSNFNTNLDSTITDVQKLAEKVDKLTIGSTSGEIVTYSTTTPIPSSIGGITNGKTYTNATITQVLNDLLYPYITPIDTLTSNISTGIYEYGTQINSITLINDIIKKSNNITKVEYYKNDTLLYTNNSPLILGGKDSYIDNNIKDTTNFYCKIYDTIGSITSNILNYTFVNPYYIGTNINKILVENDIKNLTKIVKSKSDISYNFTLNNSRFIIAYPASYGTLNKILDNNGFNILNDFTLSTCVLNINSVDVLYNVYIFNNITTQFNFNIQFKY